MGSWRVGRSFGRDELDEREAHDRDRNPDRREFEKAHLLEPGFAHQARDRQRGAGADHGGRAAEDRRVAERDQEPARRQTPPPRPVDHGGRHHRDDRRVVEKGREGRDRGADAREPARLAPGAVHQAPDGRLESARFAQCRRYDEQRADRGKGRIRETLEGFAWREHPESCKGEEAGHQDEVRSGELLHHPEEGEEHHRQRQPTLPLHRRGTIHQHSRHCRRHGFRTHKSHRRVAPFTEKGFYLSELRDRTIAIAVPAGLLSEGAALEPVLKDLEANRTRVILISDGAEAARTARGKRALDAGEPATLPGRVWRRLGHNLRVGVATDVGSGLRGGLLSDRARTRDPKTGLGRRGGRFDSQPMASAIPSSTPQTCAIGSREPTPDGPHG